MVLAEEQKVELPKPQGVPNPHLKEEWQEAVAAEQQKLELPKPQEVPNPQQGSFLGIHTDGENHNKNSSAFTHVKLYLSDHEGLFTNDLVEMFVFKHMEWFTQPSSCSIGTSKSLSLKSFPSDILRVIICFNNPNSIHPFDKRLESCHIHCSFGA